ncbi:helix-turn-helix domain-containing protein [Actinomadura rupiterrae]|uniref:helix-turn-helix domain-containing protein n=1 Tax=Actinomadura rupiterrae TaxID=559627 RepID=UPI0020A38FBE|nr:MerR family transcriptional regulator [Actinomadura rupiterrae]MCP2342903.1 DNA-binding transcriptional MerR regulator [Actinomadura rupiterrae]
MDETWTISELAERAAAALAADGVPRVNGRVRDLPNERLVRWYTSIGLLDPPLGRRGRTALYGPRHLLQLLAVKRRQAAGRSIAEIQIELAGAPDSVLRRIALPAPGEPAAEPAGAAPSEPAGATSVERAGTTPGERAGSPFDEPVGAVPVEPADALAVADDSDSDDGGEAIEGAGGVADSVRSDIDIAHRRDAFWTVRPDSRFHPGTAPRSVPEGAPRPEVAPRPAPGVAPRPAPVDVPALVQGVRLVPGVTLVVETRHLGEDDLAAIAESAAPLLDTLRRRGLLDPSDRDGSYRHSPGRHQ